MYKVGDRIKLTESGFLYYYVAATQFYKGIGRGSWTIDDLSGRDHIMVMLINEDGNMFRERFDVKYITHDQVYYRRLKLKKLQYGI